MKSIALYLRLHLYFHLRRPLAWLVLLCVLAAPALAQSVTPPKIQPVKMPRKELDPYGYPRPEPGQHNVPLRTSLYLELAMGKDNAKDEVLKDTVTITMQAANRETHQILKRGVQFTPGFSGWIKPRDNMGEGKTLAIYIEPQKPLDPQTTYTIQVAAQSKLGAPLPAQEGQWSFITGDPPTTQTLDFSLDLKSPAVHWQGAFFSGFCKPSFCTSPGGLEPSYERMAQVHRRYPKAWDLQRDFWLTGMDHTSEGWPPSAFHVVPNAVRELETRRISAIQTEAKGSRLKVEDFFGHEQYGIPANRPLAGDYKPGDEVLIADGTNSARAKVLEVDDSTRTVLIGPFQPAPPASPATPAAIQWKIDDPKKYPKKSDPNAPGLFPGGGCYLRKFTPAGTPRYYWGRVDREWDLAHKQYGHRLMPNFTDAPGDLSADGQNWGPPKDYAALRQVVYDITSHVIERYGKASLTFVWSIFNEPDLGIFFWRGTMDDLYKYYDYSVDGILRAFEDHGYDSNKVFIGGLELAGIFDLARLNEFLTHCSPNAKAPEAINNAYADKRLEGKRSRRVEEFCRASGGKGAPVNFVSIHAYHNSANMAAKLERAKEKALIIDAAYYKNLWINSHESCPDWAPPPDLAASDGNLGNGYYPTWCADVVWRQLTQAARDPRYSMGETILTYWPWPNGNFGETNACTQIISVDDNGDGKADRKATIPMQLFGFLELLASMGNDYQVLPARETAGHTVTGFATLAGESCRGMIYAQDAKDVQSRSGNNFKANLKLSGIPWSKVRIEEYQFDQTHNSYLTLARKFRTTKIPREYTVEEYIAMAMKGQEPPPTQVFTANELKELEDQSTLCATRTSSAQVSEKGELNLTLDMAGNGVNFFVIQPEK